MAENYYDYLVDCALIVGANEMTGLIPPQNTVNADNHPESQKYQQQILAAVSPTVAMFPFSKKSYTYPPEEFGKWEKNCEKKPTKNRPISQNELQTIHDIVNQYNKNKVSDSIDPSKAKRRNSKFVSRRRSIKNISMYDANTTWGSVSMETMKSFPAIYFNNNLQISHTYVNPKIQFIPLTDNMGNRSFAIRLEIYRKFSIIVKEETDLDKPGLVNIEPMKKENDNCSGIIYVPNNIVFFTKYPYFDLFRDILSQLFKRIENADSENIELELMEYVLILTRVPIMKSLKLQLSFAINNDIFSIKRTISIFNDILDWDMTILFQTLSVDDIISILMAMFQEHKIVFLSNDTNLITIITETIFLLFRPFHWRHFYLTTTPAHLHELVDAIFPFMLGLPHEMKQKIIEHYPDIIIVDLEEGKTLIPPSCQLKYVSKELIENLKRGLKQRSWIHSNNIISSLNPLSLDELKQNSNNFNKIFSKKVLTLFMTFMVDIFEEVIRNIPIEKKENEIIVVTFDKYLNTSQSPNVPFFKEIYKTDSFNSFIDEKIRRKIRDGWFHICTHRYPNLLDDSVLKTTLKSERHRTDSTFRGNDVDNLNLLENEKIQQVVVFPSRKNIRNNFYKDIIDYINNLENTLDIMKLRAEVMLSSGNPVQALEEFYKILQMIPSELNHSKLRQLIRGLGKKDLIKLKTMRFHSVLFEMISFDEGRISEAHYFEKIKIEQFNVPTSPIPKNNFIDECRNADIAEYEVAMNVLFNCLTLEFKMSKNRIKVVQPEIFKCFYNYWIKSSIDLRDVEMSSKNDEILIKGTETCIRVDGYGLGRLILTQFRLCFIPFAKTSSETIIDFVDNNLKKIKLDKRIRGFGKSAEVLELTVKERDAKVIIWVANDCLIWYQLISEINLVSRLADEEKDKHLVDIMTELCIMYENMVTCSRNNLFFKSNIVEIGKRMLPHINEKKVTNKNKVEDDRKYIIAKLMPSPKYLVTIDCAIEVYKPCVNNFDIWCSCMSQDTYFITILQIIDMKVFKSLEVKIEIPMRVQSMTRLPNTNKIAVCCISHIVLILDTNSHTITKRIELDISKGAYPICSASSIYDQRVLFFGTNQGEVLLWDSQMNEVNQIIKLSNDDLASSINIYNSNTIIIGSLYRFYVVSLGGEVLNVVEISELSNAMSKVSCLTLCNNNTTLIVGLARLPVLFEYDISDVTQIKCLRKKNIFTNTTFIFADFSEHYELSPSYVGITTVLMTEDDVNGSSLWIMFKDGTIEIRDSNRWVKKTKFIAHVDVISKGMICTLKGKKLVVSVGREDGKVNLWSLSPSL